MQYSEPELIFFEKFFNEDNDYFVSVYDENGELTAWNKNFRKINAAKSVTEVELLTPYDEKDNLFEIISVVDKFKIGESVFYLKTSFVLKKFFSLHNSFEERGDFAEKIKAEDNARLISDETSGGNAFPLKLNKKTIAKIVIDKTDVAGSPLFTISLIFYFLFFVLILYAVASLKTDANRKAFALVFTLLIFRILLLLVFNDFQSAHWEISDPVYFSSDLAGGFFGSLLSLFLSVIPVLLLLIYFSFYAEFRAAKFSKAKRILITAVSFLAFPATIRAFGATLRSLIFDSSIKTFSDNLNLAEPIVLFYLFDIFLVAVTFLLLLDFILRLIREFSHQNKILNFILIFAAVILFHYFSRSPQAPVLFKLILTVSLAAPAWEVFSARNKKRYPVYLALIASVSAVYLLNWHYADFEKNLYKLAAEKIAKPNAMYYKHLAETETSKIARKLAAENIKLFNNSLAYRYWNNSRFPLETFSSSLEITDSSDNTVFFYYNLGEQNDDADNFFSVQSSAKRKNFEVNTFVDFSPQRIFASRLPDFFIADNQASVSLARMLNLRLMIFENGNLIFSSLPATLTKSGKTNLLKKANRNAGKIFGDEISGKAYDLLALKNGAKTFYIFAKPEIHFAVKFFKMLKILGLFLLLILIPQFFAILPQLIKQRVKFSFRAAIFAGLIIISIVPLIFLALYFRNLSEEKNLSSMYFKLNKKALTVGKFLQNNAVNDEEDAYYLFEKASKDLRFDFSVFHKDKIYFTTHPLYFENGILPDVLNPETIVNIEIEKLNDILLNENIEKYTRNVFYSKIAFGGENYIIQIDEAFNPILLPMSEKELDVMLLTSYSVAALGIILLGLILAYYLSKPINELTEATRKIADGNLGLKIETKAFGEVKELVDGFNFMSEELKTSQQKLLESERETAWREMARQVAHEIKNPLTPMKLSLQQLIALKKENAETFNSAFDKITDSVLSQIELLKNIASEFSSLGKMPKVNLKPVNLGSLLKKVKSLYSDKHFEIVLDASVEDITVNSDEEYLTRIFVNLITNAEEAGAKTVKIFARKDKEKTEVYVENDGSKIPDEIRDKIFTQNFSTKEKGSGLGLYLSARFMEETGGKIELINSDEKTTLFKLTFGK